jgi:hypothetical protein
MTAAEPFPPPMARGRHPPSSRDLTPLRAELFISGSRQVLAEGGRSAKPSTTRPDRRISKEFGRSARGGFPMNDYR